MSFLQPTEVHLRAVEQSPRATVEALSVLVVEPDLDELLHIAALLTGAGFQVTAAASFAQAKPLLTTHSPAVLLTAWRLGMYNGLHLVVRGKAIQPQLAALVTSAAADAVLQKDTEELGATFVLKPVASEHLVASILKTRFRAGGTGEPIRPPFEQRVAQRRALEPVDPASIDRRGTDRRRAMPWLLPPAPRST
jgi:DNA-binding response OmpR family regulator